MPRQNWVVASIAALRVIACVVVLTACAEAATQQDVDVHDPAPTDASEITLETASDVACDAQEAQAFVAEGASLATGHGDCFAAIADGQALQIVRGIQGGIHVEVRLAVVSSDARPELSFEVEVVSEGTSLARFSATNVSLEPLMAPHVWATASFPVVFASADAAPYHNLHAELRARASLAGHDLSASTPIMLLAPQGELPP